MGADSVNLRIRTARSEDTGAILALSRQTNEEHRNRFPDHFPAGRIPAKRFLKDLSKRRYKGAALVAEDGTDIVGWTGLLVLNEDASGAERHILGVIIDLTVAEASRGRGVGTQLIQALIAEAKKLNVTKLHADVWIGAPSSGVLNRAGITPVRTTHEMRLGNPVKRRTAFRRIASYFDKSMPFLVMILSAIVVLQAFGR